MAKSHGSNPVSDLLETRSFQPLADALRQRADQIIARWEALVREVLPAADSLTLAQVRDHVPQTLAKLADALASEMPEDTRSLIGQAGAHGAERFHEGYNVEEVIIEYRLLRRVVVEDIEAALGRRTSTSEDIALGMGIDAVLQQGVSAFVNHQRDQLRAAAAAEAKFMAFLSHDLRNQLNHISLVVEVLTTKLADVPEYAEDVAQVRSAQRSIVDTVEGMERLLQAVRLHKGNVEIRREPVKLLKTITNVVAQFAPAAEAKGIKLAVLVPEGATVNSDRRMLALILQNLVSNAVKYSEYGTVTIAAAQTDDEWSLAVADEGPGIAPEHRETLFGEFVRGETHGQPGVGLGLAVAWQAAKLLEAELTVESGVTVGTTIRLTLPKNSVR